MSTPEEYAVSVKKISDMYHESVESLRKGYQEDWWSTLLLGVVVGGLAGFLVLLVFLKFSH